MRLLLALLLVGALLAGLPAPGGAQTVDAAAEPPALMLERGDSEAGLIERRLAEDPPEAAEIDEMRGVLDAQRDAIVGLAETAIAELKPLRLQLEALGDPPEAPVIETREIADERQRLIQLVAERDAGLKRASQAEARATALQARLTELRRKLFAEQLLDRGPSLLDPAMPGKAVAALGRTLGTIKLETIYRFNQQQISASRIFGPLMPIVVVLVAGLLLLAARRRVLDRLLRLVTPEIPHSRRAAIAASIVLTRLLPAAAALAFAVFAIGQSDLLGPRGGEVLGGLAGGAGLWIAANARGGAVLPPRAPRAARPADAGGGQHGAPAHGLQPLRRGDFDLAAGMQGDDRGGGTQLDGFGATAQAGRIGGTRIRPVELAEAEAGVMAVPGYAAGFLFALEHDDILDAGLAKRPRGGQARRAAADDDGFAPAHAAAGISSRPAASWAITQEP